MLEFLLEPIIDMQYFGCPDNCIVPDSQQHIFINFLVTPIVWIIIAVGTGLGILKRFGLPKRKHKEKVETNGYAQKIVKQQKKILTHRQEILQEAKDRKKQEKKKYLQEITNEPQKAYEDWIKSLDPTHPQTEKVKKEQAEIPKIKSPDQKILEEKVEKIMREEHLSEDKATDKVVSELEQKPVVTLGGMGINVAEDEDEDEREIFQQDIPEKKLPKKLKKLQKKLKKKSKVKWELNDLGKTRRDEYAQKIEKKLNRWVFPLPEYTGKNKDFQIPPDEISLALKKLALFISMGEFMADKKRKKSRYWIKTIMGK